jgi:flavin reductase
MKATARHKNDGNSPLRQGFLDAMSRAANSVTLVTTDGSAGRAGVTVTAASSLSADGPAPSLLVCIHHKSSACEVIRENRVFCVNLLREDQAFLSDCFAGRVALPGGDRFAAGNWGVLSTGAPVLEGVLAAFDCDLAQEISWGSHRIFIGAVREVALGRPAATLVHANRGYGRSCALGSLPEARGWAQQAA